MKVGFAVQTDEGIQSKVYNHFGSALVFIVVDIEGKDVLTINNKNLHHAHGQCNPIMALDGKSVDAMVVGGIGAGAISGLNAQGIKVYQSIAETIRQNLDLLKDGKLPLLSLQTACKGHQSAECGHHGS